MNAVETIIAIRSAGGTITIENGIPTVDAPADLPDAVWGAARAHCDELVLLLTPAAPAPVTADERSRWTADPASVSPADRRRWAEDVHARHPHHRGLEAVVEEIETFVADHAPLPPCWEDPFPHHRDRHDLPAGVACCDRCGATETADIPIHGGQSVRQDCARCGRFRRFSAWYGKEMP
jgi:hypothetical protein